MKMTRVKTDSKSLGKLVTAAIIWDGEKVLIARRGPTSKLAGLWEFPGGKVEAGETPEECLKRELFEELSVDAEIGGHVCFSDYTYEHGSFRIMAFEARIMAGQLKPVAHDQLLFVLPNQLLSFELLPADIPIAKQITSNLI
jgi:8-oxo-dGTP diphosphatase